MTCGTKLCTKFMSQAESKPCSDEPFDGFLVTSEEDLLIHALGSAGSNWPPQKIERPQYLLCWSEICSRLKKVHPGTEVHFLSAASVQERLVSTASSVSAPMQRKSRWVMPLGSTNWNCGSPEYVHVWSDF